MAGIVVGVDGSEHSRSALQWAAREARLHGTVLRPVTTFTTGFLSSGYEIALPDPGDLAQASNIMLEAAIDSVRESGELEGVEIAAEVLEGHSGERLVSLSSNADMLVVGARGHGGFVGVLMGSVTTYVVNHARCPVVVVR